MDFRVFELQSELTDLVIRISSLEASDFHQALLLHKALVALNQASLYLNKFDKSDFSSRF